MAQKVCKRPADLVSAHAGFWYRWFGGGWQEPQLVLLDHGLIVEIPDTLRQHYCQLWCSFIANDQATAKAIATHIAGVARFCLQHGSQ